MKRWLLVSITMAAFGAALSMGGVAPAEVIGASSNSVGTSIESDFLADDGGTTGPRWSVADGGGSGGNQSIYLDPTMGPWIKNLDTGNVAASIFQLVEHLVVDGGPNGLAPAWTDYHEIILTDNWVWLQDQGTHQWTSTPGGSITVTPSDADWIFNPAVQIGTQVTLTKYLQYTGDEPAPFNSIVRIAQYPTVPEPGSLLLLVSAGLGLLACPWRRRRS